MIIRDNGDIKSQSDISNCEGMPPWEDNNRDELALPIEKSLVIRRTLKVQIKENETNQTKREHLS
jgi:hypothetical protein